MIHGAGLLDLQVNGYAGVDFNDPSITASTMDYALEAMLASGVTQCLPTLITAHRAQLHERFKALDAAVAGSRLGPVMVPGYHLEGPFLNSSEGFAGCHPTEAMTDPDIAMVDAIEAGLSRPIVLVTLAPERNSGIDFISAMTCRFKVTAMAHSAAGYDVVKAAATAGMTLSTHLGNGLPQTLPKLENTLLAQLAEPRFGACLIADGHHMSPQALAALMKIKGPENCILVTDAVLGAAAPPGAYTFAGIAVERTATGAMVQPGRSNLAGSALCLDQAVRNVVRWTQTSEEAAVAMASTTPRRFLSRALERHRVTLNPGLVRWSSDLIPTVEKLATP